MDEKPVVYIFYGDDEFAISQAADQLVEHIGEASVAEINTTRLEGSASEGEIVAAATTLPFLADRRLVILNSPLSRMKEKQAHENFCAMLNRLPASAALVIIIPDRMRYRQNSWQWNTLNENHWLMKWAQEAGKRAYLKAYQLPAMGKMPHWIQTRAQELGGEISLDAAQELTSLVENDTRQAAQEIKKLLTYVNFSRPVTPQDVMRLITFSGDLNPYDMVDAIAQGSKVKAIELLHSLLQVESDYKLFSMVVRQFRQLIQTRELIDEGKGSPQVEKVLGVYPSIARKLIYQANRFDMQQLVGLHHRLLEMDKDVKTGGMGVEVALNLLVTGMD